MSQTHVLAIDQGTTSTRAIVFDASARAVSHRRGANLAQHYPASGWVEHDAEDIWRDDARHGARGDRGSGVGAADIAAIGITNQRETAVIWERAQRQARFTGPSSGRTGARADVCATLKRRGCRAARAAQDRTAARSVLLRHQACLDARSRTRARAARGARRARLRHHRQFLLWRLTGGRVHATDVTNASRTLLFDIHAQDWDEELLRLLRVPRPLLPQVRDSSEVYGTTATVRSSARRLPIARHRRRSAGGPLRPGLLQAWHGEVHLRHGLLRAAQHGRRRGQLREPHADHARLPDRRAHHLRDGRLDLRRRRGHQVAARRTEGDRGGGRHGGRSRRRFPTTTASTWCRRSSASAHRTGIRMLAAWCAG